MTEVEQELKNCPELISAPAIGLNPRVLFRQSRQPRVAIPALIVLIAFMSFIGWGIHHSFKVRWAREQALPQIGKLIERGQLGEAYALAVQAERYIPADPTLARSWPNFLVRFHHHQPSGGVGLPQELQRAERPMGNCRPLAHPEREVSRCGFELEIPIARLYDARTRYLPVPPPARS